MAESCMGHSVSLVHKEKRNPKLRNWAQIRPHWYLNMFQTRFLDNHRWKHYQQFFNEADYNMKNFANEMGVLDQGE